ncbi:hypothetical protein O3P69_014628 [Scylla paramamosain]|uniref:Uncharacterized protein n=1 Tax=Scylla paramamosain TaxID=85552 RepID=A0AAW0U0T1_SCYPA
MDSKIAEMQRYYLLNRYENDKLEQYSRKENLRILGLEEEEDETEGILEAKIIELARDIDVKFKTDDISVAHRLGKRRGAMRPSSLYDKSYEVGAPEESEDEYLESENEQYDAEED